MATAVVSGRVDEAVRTRAARYIQQAGMLPGDVIRIVWEHIARTGEVPQEDADAAADADRWDQFMSFRDRLPEATWLATMTDGQMKDMIAGRYV